MLFSKNRDLRVDDIEEVYYILSIKNLASVLTRGLLSHNEVRAKGFYSENNDISNHSVQQNRDKTFVFAGKKTNLHDWVNCYLQPYNAMLFVVQKNIPAEELCILGISIKSLKDKPGIVLTTKNAACYDASFLPSKKWAPSPESSEAIASDYLSGFDSSSSEPDSEKFARCKQKRQAEMLFREKIEPYNIKKIFVCNDTASELVKSICLTNRPKNVLNFSLPPQVLVTPLFFPKINGTNLFQQSFRAEEVRDADKKIPPAPLETPEPLVKKRLAPDLFSGSRKRPYSSIEENNDLNDSNKEGTLYVSSGRT
jgi:hypothetical protein